MAKSENQKLKTLYVAEYFLKYSDENHPVTAREAVDYLDEKYHIPAERRSIYRDIAILREQFHMEIDGVQGGKYRLMRRPFEFEDIWIMAECIHAAKFISDTKAKELIKKIGKYLCSIYQKDLLKQEVFLCDRVKTTNSKIQYTIATIQWAMSTWQDGKPKPPQKISFKYLKYTLQNRNNQVERRKGAAYIVSPYKLLINDGNYYLLAYDDKAQDMRTYRIDRMKDVTALDAPREGKEAYEAIDIESYTRRVFSMFGGQQKRVSVRFINPLLDTAIERFGTGGDVFYRPDDERHFIVTADVEVSNQFFAWVCGFGKRAKIIGPADVVEDMQKFLKDISGMYESS